MATASPASCSPRSRAARSSSSAAGASRRRSRPRAIAGGVLWSNVLAYHDVWLAPRPALAELASIGDRFAGDGPTLMTEYQPYGVRHFLRHWIPKAAASSGGG